MRFVFDYSKRYAIRIWTLHHKSNTLGQFQELSKHEDAIHYQKVNKV